MVRGLYTAYTGMVEEQRRLDITTNNLANAATVGYKKEGVTNQAFREMLTIKMNDASSGYVNAPIGKMSLGVKIGEVYTDYSQGSFRETGNTFDFGIEGKGFFSVAVQDKEGNESTKYTRNGNFTMDSLGYVVDSEGNRLLGKDGYVQIPLDAADISVDSAGNLYSNEMFLDQLDIADFEDYDYMAKYGDNFYDALEGAARIDSTATIHQGVTEQSNVSAVTEMVQMINITRAYEANQKVISTVDSMIDKAVNSVGVVR